MSNEQMREALKSARQWIVNGSAPIGWSIDRIDAAIAQPEQRGEVVAWRWPKRGGGYVLTDDKARADDVATGPTVVEPLYTTPPAPAVPDRWPSKDEAGIPHYQILASEADMAEREGWHGKAKALRAGVRALDPGWKWCGRPECGQPVPDAVKQPVPDAVKQAIAGCNAIFGGWACWRVVDDWIAGRPRPLDAAPEVEAPAAPDGWKPVPLNPDERQWGGLARDIMLAFDLGRPTPAGLLEQLRGVGRAVPQWLLDEGEMRHPNHTLSKGTRCTIIYRAMLEDAPEPPR